jgi:hypothetical protein
LELVQRLFGRRAERWPCEQGAGGAYGSEFKKFAPGQSVGLRFAVTGTIAVSHEKSS